MKGRSQRKTNGHERMAGAKYPEMDGDRCFSSSRLCVQCLPTASSSAKAFFLLTVVPKNNAEEWILPFLSPVSACFAIFKDTKFVQRNLHPSI